MPVKLGKYPGFASSVFLTLTFYCAKRHLVRLFILSSSRHLVHVQLQVEAVNGTYHSVTHDWILHVKMQLLTFVVSILTLTSVIGHCHKSSQVLFCLGSKWLTNLTPSITTVIVDNELLESQLDQLVLRDFDVIVYGLNKCTWICRNIQSWTHSCACPVSKNKHFVFF